METQLLAINEQGRNRRVGILLICSLSLFLVGLDITAVNVALPTIGHDLHAGISGLQWTVDAYTVVMASLLMFSARWLTGSAASASSSRALVCSPLASLLCSLAPTIELLVAFRVLQAGGRLDAQPGRDVDRHQHVHGSARARAGGRRVGRGVRGLDGARSDRRRRARSAIGWRAIFWINIPVGLAAIALTLRFVPESRAPRARRFDPVGQILVIVLLATLTSGIIEAPSNGGRRL